MAADEISKAQKNKLAIYYRLLMAHSDFKHAYRCAQYSIQEHEKLAEEGVDDLILRALYSSMVVSYSRPFNSTGVSQIGKIPALTFEVQRIYSAEEAEIHKYIIWCRNKLVAHSDAEAIDPAPFVATDLEQGLVVPEKNDALAPFTHEYTQSVLRLTEKAYHWSVEERHHLEPTVKKCLPQNAFAPTDENADT